MPFVSFYHRFPRIAERETRTITVLKHSEFGLPAGDYSFLEMFCDEPGCDCRRIFFYVVSSLRRDVDAVVAWGWEPLDFYGKWMRDDDSKVLAELKGPTLNLGSPQSHLAPGILEVVEKILLRDEAYVERVKVHYTLFRGTVDGNRRRAFRGGTKSGPVRRRRRKGR